MNFAFFVFPCAGAVSPTEHAEDRALGVNPEHMHR